MRSCPFGIIRVQCNFIWLNLFLFFFISGYSQEPENRLISVSITNEKLSDALSQLSLHEGINLSFNASDPSFDQRITYQAYGKKITDLLDDILSGTNHDYKQIGNHIVIIPTEKPDILPATGSNKDKGYLTLTNTISGSYDNSTAYQNEVLIKPNSDPGVRTDTIRIIETIINTDTIHIRDTVFIDRIIYERRKTQGISNYKDVFRFEPDREDGLAISFHYAQILSDYLVKEKYGQQADLEKYKKADVLSFRSFALGSAVQLNKKRFSVSAGLNLTRFANRFIYSSITQAGGFFSPDTLDTFYTIIGADTLWSFVTDSSYIPIDRNEIEVDRLNRIGMLEMQIAGNFTLYADKNKSFYVKAAFNAGMPITARGIVFTDPDGTEVEPLNTLMINNWNLSYQAGAGFRHKAGNWTDIFGEITYKRFLTEIVEQDPVARYLHGLGINVGILYYF